LNFEEKQKDLAGITKSQESPSLLNLVQFNSPRHWWNYFPMSRNFLEPITPCFWGRLLFQGPIIQFI